MGIKNDDWLGQLQRDAAKRSYEELYGKTEEQRIREIIRGSGISDYAAKEQFRKEAGRAWEERQERFEQTHPDLR